MAVRIVQVCGLWFWVAFIFFGIVVLHQSQTLLPNSISIPNTSSTSAKSLEAPSRTIGLTTRQRMTRSETSWRASVNLRHEMAKAHPQNPKIPFFPAQEMSDFGKYPYTLWDFFPATYTCPHDIQRVGRLGDGGKWVCGMSLYEARPPPTISHSSTNPPTIIYSFGVNDESTFEAEMLSRIPSAQIYAYDFSVTRFGPQLSASYSARAHFKQVGLGQNDELNKNPQFFTLNTLMKQNKHTYIDILKIDIEGSEYTALDTFMDWCENENGGVMPVGQVMIELHLVDDKNVNFDVFTKWWERLEKLGLRPTWLEINLLAVTLGKGKTDPRCVEYVFVNARDEKSVLLLE
ncbi:methyltransferase domain-containing protein [Tricladium varicosporioides]|nr:methyltransferase domain-containing protein [Hymenoscyphus varicosporioides]